MGIQPWRHVNGSFLMVLLNVFTAIALIFEGYNQGVLGSVSNTPAFIEMAQIGKDGVVTNSTKQGGLVAAYYFGALCSCFVGGMFHLFICLFQSFGCSLLTIFKDGLEISSVAESVLSWVP